MSINTITLTGNPQGLGGIIPPPPQAHKSLITDDEIDKLIAAQMPPSPQQTYQPSAMDQINQAQSSNQQSQLPEQNEEELETKSDTNEINFNLTAMHTNLDAIVTSTKNRISGLIVQQDKLNSRVLLLEKFIKLDEKELAIEVASTNPNTAKIGGLRKAITNQTELFGATLDILLKFEAQIQSWTKTLMDVEKDKVSAYQKIKSVNKEQASTETDINEVLLNLNNVIRTNPDKIVSFAENSLNINGYSGKKFNQ